MSESQYTLHVHREDADDSYWATIEELPGLFASGFSLEELRECVGESIPLYLSDDSGPVEPVSISPDLTVGEIRISVAA